MKAITLATALIVTPLIGPGLGAAEDAPAEKPGLPVGQHAPAFALTNQDGNAVSLDSLLKRGPVALVFFRSADWCTYCKLQLVQLQKHLGEFTATGGQIVGISYDPVDVLHGFAKRNGITFPLLSDAGSLIIDAYDIRNKEAPPRVAGVPRHATFIIDQTGVIRTKLYQVSYRERPAVEALVAALKDARSANTNAVAAAGP